MACQEVFFSGDETMRLSLQIEQFLFQHRTTTIKTLARRFRISEDRCWEELTALMPFGVAVDHDGQILAEEAE